MTAEPTGRGSGPEAADLRPTWTGRLRVRAVRALPPDKVLPDTQPAYVASWIYVFGALTLAAFAVVVLSGAVLALKGPSWWHISSAGLFVNSIHLWSTELFFFFMVIHLWGKFFMAAWRGKRRATWVTGSLAFVVSIATAFTGYLSQQNFDSEWISTQAKDGINATGAGAYWNVLNFGQMLMWHIVLLPAVVGFFVGIHVLLVRRRGVVPPFAADTEKVPGRLAAAGGDREVVRVAATAAGPATAGPVAAGPGVAATAAAPTATTAAPTATAAAPTATAAAPTATAAGPAAPGLAPNAAAGEVQP